jgi:hypothetical protein
MTKVSPKMNGARVWWPNSLLRSHIGMVNEVHSHFLMVNESGGDHKW